jgi:hypothetical protein
MTAKDMDALAAGLAAQYGSDLRRKTVIGATDAEKAEARVRAMAMLRKGGEQSVK